MSSTCDAKRFFSFDFSGEQRREMQQLLRAVLNGDYETKKSPHKGKVVQPIRSESIDLAYQQTSTTDSELSDDEFSVSDEFSDDHVD
jgi:hypothetical protein